MTPVSYTHRGVYKRQFMTIILPVMLAFLGGPIFGGAKPVPVNPRNYRNYRRGDIIVSLAGVITNVCLLYTSRCV